MLMRVREIVDYNRVQDQHREIHARLENWAKWLRPRVSGWHTHPMWRNSRTSNQWEASPYIGASIDALDALAIEKAVSALPHKHRDAIRWYYYHKGNPAAMARNLGLSKQGLADLVDSGRTMLKNRIGG
jgi:DNA-directed RNA polymerase specialized sigma24 family protein